MSYQEFAKKDMALQEEIADLRMQMFQLVADFGMVNKSIVALQHKRTELHNEYAATAKENIEQ